MDKYTCESQFFVFWGTRGLCGSGGFQRGQDGVCPGTSPIVSSMGTWQGQSGEPVAALLHD